MSKTLIWCGLFLGSTLGGCIPLLWGGSLMSGWGILGSVVGGLAGIWAGFKASEALGV